MKEEPQHLDAIILYADNHSARKVCVPVKKNPSFEFNNQTYDIRDEAKYLHRRGKIGMKKLFGRIPFPWLKIVKEYRSYYRAGDPNPFAWTASTSFSAEDLYVMETEKSTVRGMSAALAGEHKKKKLGGMKWIIILMLIIGGVAGVLLILPHILRLLGMG